MPIIETRIVHAIKDDPSREYWFVQIKGQWNFIDLYVTEEGYAGCKRQYSSLENAQTANDLFLENNKEGKGTKMRKFDSGATRNNVEGRLNYVKALSPIVLERYVQYLNAHREQADGTMRDFDNWKKGIPIDVYLEGLGRHFIAVWQLAHGFPAEDNKGPVTLEDTLCAIIFNASGWLHEIIKEERKDICGEKKAKTDSALVMCIKVENCSLGDCSHSKPHKFGTAASSCSPSRGCMGRCEKVKETLHAKLHKWD